MIAMQYSFTLPADYDMSIIERRVAELGHALDQHQPLLFKAYNLVRQGQHGSAENLYAPFYLWKDTAGMADFLCGAGFKRLVAAFGWPAVRHWPMLLAHAQAGIPHARFATREIVPLAPFTPLETLRAQEAAAAARAVEQGATSALAALEPAGWTLVRFRSWRTPQPGLLEPGVQAYEVAHLSHPGIPAGD
jgi:hypothetical protein